MSTGSNSGCGCTKSTNASIDTSGATQRRLEGTHMLATTQAAVQPAQQDKYSIHRCRYQLNFSERFAFRSNQSLATVADPDLLLEEA